MRAGPNRSAPRPPGPVGDTFESLSLGVLDGSMASVSDLISYRLIDVAKYVIELPLGTYHTTSNFTVASQVWPFRPEKYSGSGLWTERSRQIGGTSVGRRGDDSMVKT